MGNGIIEFANQPQFTQLYLNAQPVIGGTASLDPTSATSNPVLLPTQGGTHTAQTIFRGGSAPASLRARSWNVKIQMAEEEDFFLAERIAQMGVPFLCFFGLPIADVWYASGQALFSTSRPLPYGGSLTGANPPTTSNCTLRAFINGVEKAVIFTGTPGAGQVLVLTSVLAQHDAVWPGDSLSPGAMLELRYYPLHWCTVDPSASLPQLNDYEWSAKLNEAVSGDFS